MSVMVQKNIREGNFHHPGDSQATHTQVVNTMLSSRRNETVECCFICGANQTIWLLNSNPTTDNKPFFPFLQYQKPPLNANKLDSIGRCLSCNVCYLFLIQQWKTYQEGNIPIHKRLYWLKRPIEEYNIGKCQGEMTQINHAMNNLGGREVVQKHYISDSSRTLGSMETDSERKYYDNEEKNVDDTLDFMTCSLCSAKEKNESMNCVLTKAQTSLDVPFYSKIIIGKNGSPKTDCGEKILVCVQCNSMLYRQWLEFEKLSIPRIDREFIIIPVGTVLSDAEYLACFVCHEILPQDAPQPLYCKKLGDEPFFPFLKNLPKSLNTCPLRENGVTSCCHKCKLFLRKQWDIFQECNVAQEERVYRIHPSQPPLIPSEINLNRNIACFICSAKNVVKMSKRIYCNSGSNMNLSFLKSFPRNKDGHFSEETGETFVCISCFKELKQHWVKYRATLFESPSLINPIEVSKSNSQKIASMVCEICTLKLPDDAIRKLNILPIINNNNNEKEIPFFPSLKNLRQSNDKSALSACHLCYLNLTNQWASFEDSNDVNKVSRYERIYKFQEFTCDVCNKVVQRDSIVLDDLHNINDVVEIHAKKLSLKSNSVSLCIECKTRCLKIGTVDSFREDEIEIEIENRESLVKDVATVPLFSDCNTSNKEISNIPSTISAAPSLSSSLSSEGSFAAALRKLAQQPTLLPASLRDKRRESPIHIITARPSQLTSHVTGKPSAIAPGNLVKTEKQDVPINNTYNQVHSREHERRSKDGTSRYPDHFSPPLRDERNRIYKDKHEGNLRDAFDPNNLSSTALVPKSKILYDDEKPKLTSPTTIPTFSGFGAFTPPQHHHQHGAQSSCPVHSHEVNHQHKHQHSHDIGHKHEHSNHSQVTLFDPPSHTTREFHHPQRLQEELQFVHGRHLPVHHALEKDIRSGMESQWPVVPPQHVLDEHYKQYGSKPSAFTPKDSNRRHNVYYGREHPATVDPYMTRGVPSDTIQHHGPLISPRLFKDYYKRSEHYLSERTSCERPHIGDGNDKKFAIQLSDQVKHKDSSKVEHAAQDTKEEDNEHNLIYLKDNREHIHCSTVLDVNTNPCETGEITLKSTLPFLNVKSEIYDSGIQVKTNSINMSPRSLISDHDTAKKTIKLEDDEEEWNSEVKISYMELLGLVSHSRKRVLTEDYEHKRWGRKFNKSQPKKRTKQNIECSSDNGDSRPNSELDFYSGPMTRHMQQLLLEQEDLLEQIQKKNNDNNNNTNAGGDPSDNITSRNQVSMSSKLSKHLEKENVNVSSVHDSLESIMNPKNSPDEGDDQQTNNEQTVNKDHLLDNSLFGETVNESNPKACSNWCGVEHIRNAYLDYSSECNLKQKQLMESCEEMENKNIWLQQRHESVTKKLLTSENKSKCVSDERQELQGNLDNINGLLGSIQNL